MRKIVVFFLIILLLAVTANGAVPFVVDDGHLLNHTAESSLEKQFTQLYTEYGCSVAVVTKDSFGGKAPAEVAGEHYKSSLYDNDGILLLISQSEGQWYIYTSGLCTQLIPDSDAAAIGSAITEDLQAGDYYNAVQTFCQMASKPICQEYNRAVAQQKQTQRQYSLLMGLGLLGALMIGVILVLLLRKVAPKSQPEEGASETKISKQ